MKFIFRQDETLSLDLINIAKNLNRIFPKSVSFKADNAPIKIPGSSIVNPDSYVKLSKLGTVKAAINTADCVIWITKKPYDNNYFWDPAPGKLVIFSSSGWEDLTTLPRSNGLAFLVGFIISNNIGIGAAGRHDKVTGCINDFLWDKKGIDVCMRSAFICATCKKEFRKVKLTEGGKRIYGSLSKLFNDLSTASRADNDVLKFWGFKASKTTFDVFLCHNSEDKKQIRLIYSQLKKQGVRPWLDEEQIPPGRPWQDALEKTISKIRTAAVFVGSSGFGPWQQMEVKVILEEFARRRCPVIPVILPDSKKVPKLPLFMRQFMWVDYRKKHLDPFKQLMWGITGGKF